MNRSRPFDSNCSLDALPFFGFPDGMEQPLPCLLLTRIDPTRNMARFYMLAIEASLFGDCALVRSWGRIGSKGNFRIELCRDRREAETRLGRIWLSKMRRGYLSTG